MKKILFSIIAMMMSAFTVSAQTAKFAPVVKSVKTETGQRDTYADGSTKSFEATTSSEVSFEDKVAVINGEKLAVKPTYRRTDGTLKHCVSTTVLGGGRMTTKGDFHPTVTGRITYNTDHMLFSLSGQWTQAMYPDGAEVSGKYSVFNATGDVAVKVLQSSTHHSYLAGGLEAGCGFQRTDARESTADSHNYGLIVGAFLQGRVAINHQFGVIFRGGYRMDPYVVHGGGDQKKNHGSGYLEVGFDIKFRQQPVKR